LQVVLGLLDEHGGQLKVSRHRSGAKTVWAEIPTSVHQGARHPLAGARTGEASVPAAAEPALASGGATGLGERPGIAGLDARNRALAPTLPPIGH
jgi:hypothetical protein